MTAVRGKAYASAHHDAVHERHIGFREFGDARVENVLLAPQDLAEIAFDFRTFIARPDVAARRKDARLPGAPPAESGRSRDRPRTGRALCRYRETSPASRH